MPLPVDVDVPVDVAGVGFSSVTTSPPHATIQPAVMYANMTKTKASIL